MAQDLFRFHNREKFEVHVYATTPNDNDYFLEHAMDGVDWRAKVFVV
jgi:predicted O-linked N-acetylglucosamine transferase (SPINDLY family)